MKFIFSIFLLVSGIQIHAQNGTIKGTISDAYNTVLPSVYVYNLATKKHTHTSENGRFALPESTTGDTLQVRLLGFKTQEIVILPENFNTEVDITLENNIFRLDELVLTQEIDPLRIISKVDHSYKSRNFFPTVTSKGSRFIYRSTCRRRKSRTDFPSGI